MSQNAELTEIKLSGDRVARVVPVKGKHIRLARKMQLEAGHDYLFALIAQITTIDGVGIVPEDLDDMPGRDIARLQTAIEGN